MTANFFEFQAKLRRPGAASGAASSAAGDDKALSVSELTGRITRVLGAGLPPTVLVRGEVTNLNRNKSSGHLYFTLKDPEACLDCVMFRGDAARLKFEPVHGMELLAGGRVGVYPQRGRYQLYVNTLRPLGQGALELAFRQVRAKLEAEGLFAADRKRTLPRYPMRVLIITSREAAALQDVLKVLRRFPWLQVLLWHVPVQGEGATVKIAEALAIANRRAGMGDAAGAGRADVILLTRGGGSLEDLWCFNEEVVARAVAASTIPIVTGIGHEVDVSIADLAADYHAHTPTEAAQVVTAHWRGADESLDDAAVRLRRALRTLASDAGQRLRAIERHEAFRRPTDRLNALRQLLDDRQRSLGIAHERLLHQFQERVREATARAERFLPSFLARHRDFLARRRQQLDLALARRLRGAHDRLARAAATIHQFHPRFRVSLAAQRLDSIENRLRRAIAERIARQSRHLAAIERQLEAVSPRSVLRRGYTITTRKKDGLSLRSAAQLKPGDRIITRFADGEAQSVIEDSRQLSLFD